MAKRKIKYQKGGSFSKSFAEGFTSPIKPLIDHIQQNKPHLNSKIFTTIRDAAKKAATAKKGHGGPVAKDYIGNPLGYFNDRRQYMQQGKEVTDVTGDAYTLTDTGKKVNENTYIDYGMEYGYTPTKREVKRYKRKVKKGKI